ncbi:hypothetical protein N505_0102130 [Rhodococcus aetherivorans]|nr:hypothetical protein N505_0102130 [Rhodococcus aetherivorans]
MRQEQFGAALAPLLGKAWSRQSVSLAEQGGRAFTAAELVAISRVLGVSVGKLLSPKTPTVTMPSGQDIKAKELGWALDLEGAEIPPASLAAIGDMLDTAMAAHERGLEELRTTQVALDAATEATWGLYRRSSSIAEPEV